MVRMVVTDTDMIVLLVTTTPLQMPIWALVLSIAIATVSYLLRF